MAVDIHAYAWDLILDNFSTLQQKQISDQDGGSSDEEDDAKHDGKNSDDSLDEEDMEHDGKSTKKKKPVVKQKTSNRKSSRKVNHVYTKLTKDPAVKLNQEIVYKYWMLMRWQLLRQSRK